jgi:hypothetical protein
MKTEDIEGWEIQPKPSNDSEIQCPSCLLWLHISNWKLYETECDSCGGHDVMHCPECHEEIDRFYTSKVIVSRLSENKAITENLPPAQ